LSNDGCQALTGSSDGTVRLWDCGSGSEVACLKGHQGPVNAVAFSPDGERALSGGADGSVRLWSLASGRQLKSFQGRRDQVISCACSPDGNHALSGSRDAPIRLWQLPIANVSAPSAEALEMLDNLPYSSVQACVHEVRRARIFDRAQEAALTGAMCARFVTPK